MKKGIQKIILTIIICAMFITSGSIYRADENTQAQQTGTIGTDVGRLVRVGYYHMNGFHYYDEYGELRGYGIEYLNMIAGFTGWEYEYVPVGDFGAGLKMLEAKEIDLLAPAMRTKEREQAYDYSALSFGTEYTVLVTKENRNDVFYEDYEKFSDMKIAVLKDYPLTEYFISYMDTYNFSSELVYYNTSEESKKALHSGEVDALVTSIMDMENDEKLLARFAPQPFYFLSWQGNKELLKTLDAAMQQVQNTYPVRVDELFVSNYPIYQKLYFSREEMEYIKSKKTLKVAYVGDRRPLSFTNATGEFDGISREIFDEVAKITGLSFEYVALPEGEITYENLLKEGIDLLTGVEQNPINLADKNKLLSIPYLSSRKVMVSTEGFGYKLDNKYKIALPEDAQDLSKVINVMYPNLEIVYYKNNSACFEALYRREINLLLQNQYVVEGILSKPSYSDFVVVPTEGIEEELCFSAVVSADGTKGMKEEECMRLIAILNKAISQVEDQTLDNIIVRETLQNKYQLDLLDFLYSYRLVLFAMFLALLFMAMYLISVRQNKKRKEEEKERENRRKELQRRRYETILECSDDLIYEISMSGDSSISSDKIRQKFGWEIPKKVEDLDFSKAMQLLHIHPDDEKIFRQTDLTKGKGMSDELIVRIGKTDGTYLWCKISRTLLMDEKNNVVSILGKIEDIDASVRQRTELEIQSRTDALSNLLNKVTFNKEVSEFLSKNSSQGAAFIFMDMDHFKDINDKLGHQKGDEVIKETARKLQLLFANFDLIGRFGGDEFCIFVKDIQKDVLLRKLNYAVEKLREDYPCGDGAIHLSASMGVAYCLRSDVPFKEMLEIADEALYKAKANGRNCYVITDITE